MSYQKFNPIHFIKGRKTIEEQELLKKHITTDESKKRTILTIITYLIPFFYIYFILIITSNFELSEYRNYLYLPSLIFFFLLKRKSIYFERYLIDQAIKREGAE